VTPTTIPPSVPPPLWGLDTGEKVVAAIALALVVVGLVGAFKTFLRVEAGDSPRVRLLIALHAFARGGFWIGLGAILLAQAFRGVFGKTSLVFFAIPLVMAGIRVLTGHALIRALPDDGG
jgi:hypothetical protein